MNHEQFAKRIVELRKKKGYTQMQLANRLHVSHTTISRWETAEGYPDITLLKPLSEALGVSCDDLLSDAPASNLQRKHTPHYLSYGISFAALLLYFVLVKLGLPQLLSFVIFCALEVGCFQRMLHEGRGELPAWIRWTLLLSYLPIVGVLHTIFFYMMAVVNGAQEMFNLALLQEIHDQNQLFAYLEHGMTILLVIYAAAVVLTLLLYFGLRHILIVRYDISWKHLLTHKELQEKEKHNPCFTKWSYNHERMLHVLYALLTILLCVFLFSSIYTTYRELIAQYRYTLPPMDGRQDYAAAMSLDALLLLRKKLLWILGTAYLLLLLPLCKCRKVRSLWLSMTVFLLYATLLLAQITFVERIYMQIPTWFAIVGGLVVIACYGYDLMRIGKWKE